MHGYSPTTTNLIFAMLALFSLSQANIAYSASLFLNEDLISKHQFVSPSLDATRLENVAKFRPASQSSVTDEDASKAVDGNLDTCANTTMKTNPWWSVDLGKDQHFLENCQAEISPATDTTFQIGYYAEGNKKFSISSEIHLAEAFSLVKNGKITLWVDPHKDVPRSSLGRKRKGNSSVQDDRGTEKKKEVMNLAFHDLEGSMTFPSLNCAVNGTHNSEDTPPNVPFFTGISKASKPSKTVTSGEFSTQSTDNAERKVRIRSSILQQLKDLKALREDTVLTENEFSSQKEKLLKELNSL
ncbi:hypothetical protein P5673_020149 [Acropora cervicornis]|uniref:F5/8 type C domain-containing protein n=1 Tax=Acropora cervicornis TaxID=6130 RepID=A0AAD9QBD8_ACRCE|nr:hypothetical protein P5673_020149 [Acropora cervicornis]